MYSLEVKLSLERHYEYSVGTSPFGLAGINLHCAADQRVLCFTLRPAGTDVVEPALSVLDDLAGRNFEIGELVVDRGFSYKTADRWAAQLRERGIRQVQDIHPVELGVRDWEGIPIVAGVPHCPGCPGISDDISRPVHLQVGPLRPRASRERQLTHEKHRRELKAFDARITDRTHFAMVRHQGAGLSARDQGKSRWVCPARAGKVICSLVDFSAHYPPDRPKVEHPPEFETAPRCCTQQTFMVPGAAIEKLRQEHIWGTSAWRESYSRRTHVEGIFGNLRNPDTENLRRGYCRVRGLVKNTLMLSVLVVAANIRLTREWAKHVGDFSDPLTVPFEENYGFEELDQFGRIRRYPQGDLDEPPLVGTG